MPTSSMPLLCGLVLVALPLQMPASAFAQSSPHSATSRVSRGTLSFTGHATVGSFIGSTSTVSGVVTGDLSNIKGWVEAPVATLITHNDHRDRDLRASMEVDKYPTLRFDLVRAQRVATHPAQDDSIELMLHGALTIHGATRLVDLPTTIVRSQDTLHVMSTFPLDLADYGIGGLRKAFGLLRMERNIEVRVDLWFLGDVLKRAPAGTPETS